MLKGKMAKNVDLVKILLAWKAAYGNSILFVHIYSHTGKEDSLSIGNAGADKLAVACAKLGRGDREGITMVAVRPPQLPCHSDADFEQNNN